MYLQGKQDLLNGWSLGAKEYRSFFERRFRGKLTKAELKAQILEVQRSVIGQNEEKRSSS